MKSLTIGDIITIMLLVILFTSALSGLFFGIYNYSKYADVEYRIEQLETDASELREAMEVAIPERCFEVTLTAYTPTHGQTDSTPTVTATGAKAIPGRTAAVSRDLIPNLMGHKIYVHGYGVFVVNDVMAHSATGGIDLCVGDKKTALNIGRRQHIVVIVD